MTAYIRRGGGKKREQLERAEAAIRTALAGSGARERVRRVAEQLRAAHLRYLKALLHELRPDGPGVGWRALADQYHRAQRKWERMTCDEIIAAYKTDETDG